MRRFLCLILFLFLFTKVAAQKSDSCFYHFSFYNWKWVYGYGFDTIPVQDFEGNYIFDTILYRLGGETYWANLDFPIPQSLDTSTFVVKSCKNNHAYKLESINVYRYRNGKKSRELHFKGPKLYSEFITFLKSSVDSDYADLTPVFKDETTGEIVSTTISIGIKAPPKLTCYYHLRFYIWDWDYCSMIDTVLLFDSKRVFQKDTTLIDTSYFPNDFAVSPRGHPIEHSFRPSFQGTKFTITSTEDDQPIEVIGFRVIPLYPRDHDKEILCHGATLSLKASDLLNKCKPKEEVIITDLKIYNRDLNKAVTLPGFKFRF